MSKLRQQLHEFPGDLETPPEGDLRPFVIFTQLNRKASHVYAGWVDAVDEQMALQFAREHYGQDQECVNLWAIPRTAIGAPEPGYPASAEQGPARPYAVFTQKSSGDPHNAAGTVEATSSRAALEAALAKWTADSIWVVPREEIFTTDEDDVIWRLTDQTYRLARGYSADVRQKWEKIRAKRDIKEYEKDDLKETF